MGRPVVELLMGVELNPFKPFHNFDSVRGGAKMEVVFVCHFEKPKLNHLENVAPPLHRSQVSPGSVSLDMMIPFLNDFCTGGGAEYVDNVVHAFA